jgi:hypothetical protein
MKPQTTISRAAPRRFCAAEEGTTLVEFAIVLPLFLLLFLGLIDFGRLAFQYVTIEKSVQMAARIAAVRPAACAGVPSTNARGSYVADPMPRYGTHCSFDANLCAAAAPIQCDGTEAGVNSDVVSEIAAALPFPVPAADLRFIYSYDPNLNFLGGPYVAAVTVEARQVPFTFITPLGGLVAMATGTAPTGGGDLNALTFPTLRATVPGEDLAQGMDG